MSQICYLVVFNLFFGDFTAFNLMKMNDSKLIKILRTFSNKEISSFEKFIASPFFNSVKIYLPFFKELLKFYPIFNDYRLNDEYIYKKLYKGKPINKQVMWNLKSGLEKLANDFLEQIALKKNEFKRMELLISEFGSRKLLSNYLHTLNKMDKQLETNAIDYAYFENKGHFETYKQGYYHLMDKIQPMSDSKRKASEYEILLFLRVTIGGLNDMSVLAKNYNYSFDINVLLEFAKHIDLKSILQYARSKNYEYAFLIGIYYHSLMMLLEPGETKHLNKVRALFRINFNKFTLSEKRTIMHWITNYCISRSQTEGIKYDRIIFELNKFRLKEGLAFYPEGQIPKAIYNQILSVALSAGKTKWAENFIKNYTSMLQPEIRKSIEAMANAWLHFKTKDFDKVLKDLNNVEFIDITDKLYARSILARTFYELKNFDSLLSYIDSSKHFFKKNKSVSDQHQKSFGKFYYFLMQLISVNEKTDLHSIHVIKKEILALKELENKNWLLKKVEEIEKSN
jgi:hypothetical protein